MFSVLKYLNISQLCLAFVIINEETGDETLINETYRRFIYGRDTKMD